jgi:hypothetical protein
MSIKESGVTAEVARAIYEYNAETGDLIFRRRSRFGPDRTGRIAGCTKSRKGYRTVYINGIVYYAHRVIWLIVHGYWPKHHIDHINRDPADNRLCNLREATCSQNNYNSRLSSRNKIGVKGVYFDRGRYRGQVWCDGQYHNAGYHKSFEVAVQATLKLRLRLHGEFARCA